MCQVQLYLHRCDYGTRILFMSPCTRLHAASVQCDCTQALVLSMGLHACSNFKQFSSTPRTSVCDRNYCILFRAYHTK